jgi:hypothetical protein
MYNRLPVLCFLFFQLTAGIFGGRTMLSGNETDKPADLATKLPETPELPGEVWQRLPRPVIDDHPEWITLYRASWKYMYEKIMPGNTANGFVESYIDEGFNENIYQWDSCFMAAYAIYGPDDFPAMQTLDNFYNHQREDGYICRCYNQETGWATGQRDLNPPLFAWMEWRYYRLSGDAGRFERVLPVLVNYYDWIIDNMESKKWRGLYYITDFGSGMDNSPRGVWVRKGAWIDLCSQLVLSADFMARMAAVTGDRKTERRFQREKKRLSDRINRLMWNDEAGNYYDLREDGRMHTRNTIASFWPMLAGVSDESRAARMIDEHLKNPERFYRKHLFPTLAADDPWYDPGGHYWRGGVWAPTNFAIIKGLERIDRAFAREAAVNHVEQMSRVLHDFDPAQYRYPMPAIDEPNIPRNGNGTGQVWEAYAPDETAPATRWDAEQLVRQKFCGWSGVGPVALLIETILGFECDAPANTITWHLAEEGRHGILDLPFNGGRVSLVVAARFDGDNPSGTERTVMVAADNPFRLVVIAPGSDVPLFDGLVGTSEISIAIQS